MLKIISGMLGFALLVASLISFVAGSSIAFTTGNMEFLDDSIAYAFGSMVSFGYHYY